jgi:HEAT repeat protein
MSLSNWQLSFLTLSILGSNILGVMVASLVAILVVTKVIGVLWEKYRRRREAFLKSLALEFLHTGNAEAKLRLMNLAWRDALILKAILLELSEGVSGIQQSRATELYEFSGIADKEIRTLRRSWFWWLRAASAHALGQMRVKRAKNDLIRALGDKSIEVRLEATWAMGHMGFVDTLPLIMESMSRFFKIAALRMDAFIFEMGAPALPLLLDLCKHPEQEIQLLAIHLVGEFKDPGTLEVLLPLLDSQNLEIRLAASKAIGSIGDPLGLSGIIPYLKDSAWQMRAQAAKQFGRNGFTPAIPGLLECLEDRAWWVRLNAGEALSQMGGSGMIALKEALKSEDRFARDMASQWLDELEAIS